MKRENIHYLQEFIDFLKMNPDSFAASLGLKRADKIYHALKGRNGISSDLAKLITEKYPDASYNWLLTGNGEMLKSNIKDRSMETGVDDKLSLLERNKDHSIGDGNVETVTVSKDAWDLIQKQAQIILSQQSDNSSMLRTIEVLSKKIPDTVGTAKIAHAGRIK